MTGDTDRLDEVLSQLNALQLKFVEARIDTRFDREAAAKAGCHEKTPIKWRKDGVPINEAVELLLQERIRSARDSMRAVAPRAVAVLVDEMEKGGPERVRAALAVLDRIGLPATSRVEGEIATAGIMVVLDDPNQL